MAFLQIQSRTTPAAPFTLSGLSGILRAMLASRAESPRRSPEQILAAQARRAEARAAVDRLLR